MAAVGAATLFTDVLTDVFAGVFTDVFTDVFPDVVTGTFTGAFAAVFTGVFTDVFTAVFTDVFIVVFTDVVVHESARRVLFGKIFRKLRIQGRVLTASHYSRGLPELLIWVLSASICGQFIISKEFWSQGRIFVLGTTYLRQARCFIVAGSRFQMTKTKFKALTRIPPGQGFRNMVCWFVTLWFAGLFFRV